MSWIPDADPEIDSQAMSEALRSLADAGRSTAARLQEMAEGHRRLTVEMNRGMAALGFTLVTINGRVVAVRRGERL